MAGHAFKEFAFHGTGSASAAEGAMRDGLRPPASSRARLAAAPGFVYLTEDPGLAAFFALGRKPGMPVLFGPGPGEDRFGFVLSFNSSSFDEVRPDEDSVGLFASEHTEQARGSRSYRPRRPSGLFFGPEIAAGVPDGEKRAVWEWLSGAMPAKAWEGLAWPEGQKAFGKAAARRMPPEVRDAFLSWGAHIAHRGRVLMPSACWRIAKADGPKLAPDGSDLFDVAELAWEAEPPGPRGP